MGMFDNYDDKVLAVLCTHCGAIFEATKDRQNETVALNDCTFWSCPYCTLNVDGPAKPMDLDKLRKSNKLDSEEFKNARSEQKGRLINRFGESFRKNSLNSNSLKSSSDFGNASTEERIAEARAHAGGLVPKKSTWTHKKNGGFKEQAELMGLTPDHKGWVDEQATTGDRAIDGAEEQDAAEVTPTSVIILGIVGLIVMGGYSYFSLSESKIYAVFILGVLALIVILGLNIMGKNTGGKLNVRNYANKKIKQYNPYNNSQEETN